MPSSKNHKNHKCSSDSSDSCGKKDPDEVVVYSPPLLSAAPEVLGGTGGTFYVPFYSLQSPPDAKVVISRHLFGVSNNGSAFNTVFGDVDLRLVKIDHSLAEYTGPVTFTLSPPEVGTPVYSPVLNTFRVLCTESFIDRPTVAAVNGGIQISFHVNQWKSCQTIRLRFSVTYSFVAGVTAA